MSNWPHCWHCGERLSFLGYASMGGSHSNYYGCSRCNKSAEIYDKALSIDKKYFNLNSNFHADSKNAHETPREEEK